MVIYDWRMLDYAKFTSLLYPEPLNSVYIWLLKNVVMYSLFSKPISLEEFFLCQPPLNRNTLRRPTSLCRDSYHTKHDLRNW